MCFEGVVTLYLPPSIIANYGKVPTTMTTHTTCTLPFVNVMSICISWEHIWSCSIRRTGTNILLVNLYYFNLYLHPSNKIWYPLNKPQMALWLNWSSHNLALWVHSRVDTAGGYKSKSSNVQIVKVVGICYDQWTFRLIWFFFF